MTIPTDLEARFKQLGNDLLFCTQEEAEEKVSVFLGKQPEILAADFSLNIGTRGASVLTIGLKLRAEPKIIHTIKIDIAAV